MSLDPNGEALSIDWPVYNTTSGGGVGEEVVWSVKDDGSYVEVDDFRAEGIKFLSDNALTLFGN